MKLSDFVFDYLAQLGTKHVFFLPGGGCMHLVDSLGKNKELIEVCCLHEQGATIAAEAYAQYTNDLSVALVTTGPGATNAITGVAGAWIDSTPMLVLSGQVKRPDLMGDRGVRQMGIQEVNIVPMVESITKYAVTVTDPKLIQYHLQKAVHLATHGRRGPVWIDLPLDVQGSIIEESDLLHYEPETITVGGLSSNDLQKRATITADLLLNAERPVILAGNGIRASKAKKQFETLIDILKIPVLLTWKASDFLDEEHPLNCGKPGIIGQRGANFTQQNADVLLTLGARLDLCQIGFDHSAFARGAKKIIVDIDAHEIDKIGTFVDVPVPADTGEFIDALLNAIGNRERKQGGSWLERSKQWQQAYPVVLDEYKKSKSLVNLYTLIDVLSDLLTPDDLIVPGSSGACAEVTQQAFRVKAGQRMLNTPGLGSMGFGLPASFGACLASQGRRTISVIGDGGLQHNIQELATIARLGLPLKIFILNNDGYGSIRNMQKNHFQGRLVACDPSSGLTIADTCKVAEAYGIQTYQIKDQSRLSEEVATVLNSSGTMICDVFVDPDVPTAPRMSSKALPDGRMVSKPMEELWPFLDADEFRKNMLIPVLDEE